MLFLCNRSGAGDYLK